MIRTTLSKLSEPIIYNGSTIQEMLTMGMDHFYKSFLQKDETMLSARINAKFPWFKGSSTISQVTNASFVYTIKSDKQKEVLMDNRKFGQFILKLRKEKGWTQLELAEKLNVTDKAVSKWERGVSLR